MGGKEMGDPGAFLIKKKEVGWGQKRTWVLSKEDFFFNWNNPLQMERLMMQQNMDKWEVLSL